MDRLLQGTKAFCCRSPRLAVATTVILLQECKSSFHCTRSTRFPSGPSNTNELILPYDKLLATLMHVKNDLNRPLSLAEKVVYSHLYNPNQEIVKGESYLKLRPDRVAMQDASAQMAVLQFMLAKLKSVDIPTSIHCDHLIEAFKGPKGIIHQIVLENYATPGGLMLGTGGLGMVAIGVGGADAVDAMAGLPWELKAPKILGVHLTGKLLGWASPKDIILNLVGKLTVQGGTGYIIEYFGSGVETLSCTGMATICNMGAEIGATTSIFPYTDSMTRYLQSTNRTAVSDHVKKYCTELLRPDNTDPSHIYDKIVEVDLSTLEPHINGPFTPDRSFPISQFAKSIESNDWPKEFRAGLIGSCTNSSYEDLRSISTRASSIARQGKARGIKTAVPLLMTPGSTQIQYTIARDGIQQDIINVGGQLLANACGPCIGQWKRTDIHPGETNAILSSYNRNFARRNDGNSKTLNFLASPEIVTAMSFSGRTTFNPTTDSLKDCHGKPFTFNVPMGEELPEKGFCSHDEDIFQPPNPQPDTSIIVKADSKRLERLSPFTPWNGKEMEWLTVLLKVKGKCTTDHISAAGPWLKYKYDTVPTVAREYKRRRQGWVVIGDENYGEGSAREHAAMQPRHLGGCIIIARSFARIHETNLKKQGMLPLWLVNKNDYDLIHPRATVGT
eukprot:Ihof_evm8s190 gene=Ihof_evmTU8s190